MAALRCFIGRSRGSIALNGALTFLAAMAPTLCLPHSTAATDIVVNSTADALDGTSCTLRAAVIASNTHTATAGCPAGTDNDTITLASDATYFLAQLGDTTDGPTGLPSITGTLTINGDGATVARSDASDTPPFRVLRVAAGGVVNISSLTIVNGDVPNNTGGGVLNAGTLTLTNSTVNDNTSGGGFGAGGIYNVGTLSVVQSVVSNNRADGFGGGVWNNALSETGPSGITVYTVGVLWVVGSTISNNSSGRGDGGGICNFGVATVTQSVVTGNATGTGPNGAGGNGGGIVNGFLGVDPGSLTVTGSTISDNVTGTVVGEGGGGGWGGGIFNAYGTVSVSTSIISGNRTGSGGTGTVQGGPGGDGGGIGNGDTLILLNSTVSDNQTGNGGEGGPGLGSGNGGAGGGISNYISGTATVVNSTISGNATGSGGCCGGFDSGGGIVNGGTFTLASTTVSANTAGVNRGGGVSNFSTGAMTVKNSIIATNFATDDPDCSGTLTSQGYSLVGNVAGCTIAGDPVGDIIGQDPMLGALQDNGGPTPTQALLAGSPAIDAGDPAGCTNANGAVLTRDQRGAARSRAGDTRCDIGSYEFGAAILPPCIGDCNDDGIVTVDEILVAVDIALGGLPPAACPALTTDGSDTVTIDEILQAVNSALDGCS